MLKPTYQFYNEEEPIMVSVICNCFNHEKYIEQCIESLCNQLVDFNVEILVHDDASSDNSKNIIRNLAKKYKNIKPILQEQNQYSKGCSISRDIQIPRASGKYISYCEGDDCWSNPLKLKKQIDFLEKNPDYSAACHNTVIFENGKTRVLNTTNEERDFLLCDVLDSNEKSRFHLSSFIVRKDILNLKLFEKWSKNLCGIGDLPLFIYAAAKGKIKYFPFFGSIYRKFSTTFSWSTNNEKSVNGKINTENKLARYYFELKDDMFCDDPKSYSMCNYLGLLHEYEVNYLSKNYSLLVNPKYRAVFKNKTFLHRIKVYILLILGKGKK